jgi:hypothetical protein
VGTTIGSQAQALFVQTAAAAQDAQSALDAQSLVLRRSYAMPRVAVNAVFHATEVRGKTFIIFGERSAQAHENQLNFALHLAPDPMDPVAGAGALPATPVLLPPFVVPPELQDGLVQKLKNRLAAADARLYRTELEKIDDAFSSRTDDPGFVFFALNGAGRYLLVRLGGDNDGIFLLDQVVPGEFQVYSYWGMDLDPLPWSVYHELFAALREWQRMRLPGVEYPDRQLPEKLGAIEVRGFATDMWNGYCGARRQLASPRPGPAAPSYFEVRNVAAVLNYSVPPSAGGPPDTTPFIRTQATIAIDDEDLAAPRMPVRLIAPEFVVVADARDALLGLLDENLKRDASDGKSLWSVIDPVYRSEYQRALADPARRAGALALLSYRDLPPKNQFLFVWTGTIDEEEREFAFVLCYDGSVLRDPQLVFPLEDPIGDSSTGIPVPQKPFGRAMVAYDPDHAGLHNFFHAVWIWCLSGGWF